MCLDVCLLSVFVIFLNCFIETYFEFYLGITLIKERERESMWDRGESRKKISFNIKILIIIFKQRGGGFCQKTFYICRKNSVHRIKGS